MTLGDFHTLIGDVANVSTNLDALTPIAVRQAARWIERNHTLRYMRRKETISWNPDSLGVSSFFPLDENVKSVDFVTFLIESDGSEVQELDHDKDLLHVDPTVGVPKKYRTRFDTSGSATVPGQDVEGIEVDIVPDKTYSVELYLVRYTFPWPTDTADEHWLLDNAEDVLLIASMIYLSPLARETELLQFYTPMLAPAMKTLLAAESASEQTPAGASRLGFGGTS